MIAAAIPRPARSNYEAEKLDLTALREKGVLGDAEFAQAKQRLLDKTVFTNGELDTKPVLISGSRPSVLDLPSRSGQVIVDFIVAADGSVQNVRELVGMDSDYARVWVQSVSTWRYRPGFKDGRPVATELQIRWSRQVNEMGRSPEW